MTVGFHSVRLRFYIKQELRVLPKIPKSANADGKRTEKKWKVKHDINLDERVSRLEDIIRTQNDLLIQLIERVGDTFAKQAFSVEELMVRWGYEKSSVYKIINEHSLTLLRGANGKPRKPIAVLRASVLDYENGRTLQPKNRRKPKPIPNWAERPCLPKPEIKSAFIGKGVRLGEIR